MRIDGDERNNTLIGRDEADTIHGYRGDDRLAGRGGNDTIYGDRGNDTLWGDGGNDRLYGGQGNDQLVGGAGADRLEGGAGSDKYWGGAGMDRFVFSDVTTNGSTNEIIYDFQQGEVLDFSAIDADWTRPGNQSFTFVRDGDFNGRPGEMITSLEGTGTNTYTRVYVDTDGNALADLFVTIDNGWFGFRPGEDIIL